VWVGFDLTRNFRPARVYGVTMATGDDPRAQFAGMDGTKMDVPAEPVATCLDDRSPLEPVAGREATNVADSPVFTSQALWCAECDGIFVDLGDLGTHRAFLVD